MRRFGFLLSLLTLALAPVAGAKALPKAPKKTHPAAAPAAAPPAALPYSQKVSHLPNGLTVVRIPYPSKGLVAFDTVVRVGSRNEAEKGHTGFAHFFEHMMFRGTPRFPGSARSDRLSALGFLENAFTTDDLTLYYCYGPSSSLDELVELEADRFQHLSYELPAFQTEARAVLGEYLKSAASPDVKLAEALVATAFKVHPYGHTTLGYYDDIVKMPDEYAYSLEFFKRWYVPENTILVVAGDFDDAQLMALIEKHYGGWTGKVSQTPIPAEPPQTAPRSVSIEWKTPTLPRFVEAWRTPAARLDTPDAALMQLLGEYLIGATSPLHQKAVLDEQWVDFLVSDSDLRRDPFLFVVDAALKNESHRSQLRTALESEIKTLRDGKIDSARLKDIQSEVRYGALMQLDTADAIAQRVAYYAGLFGDPAALEIQLRWLAKVTPAQLVSFAKRYLVDTSRTSAAVTTTEPTP